MAMLVEAMRASENEDAVCRLPDGTLVLVQRVLGREEPDSEEEYVVDVKPPNAAPRDRIAADDLVEAMERMAALGLPGFDPHADCWAPGPAGRRPAVEILPGMDIAQA